MLKLIVADLKMLFRNRQYFVWSMLFPLIFTTIFGLFFGRDSNISGTVSVVNQSQSELATNLVKGLKDAELFGIQEDTDLDAARDNVEKGRISAVVYIPPRFGESAPGAPNEIQIFNDPGSSQTASILTSFLNQVLNQASFQAQNARPLFSIKTEPVGSGRPFSYFDFVLSGILGMALMNASIIGIAVGISRYREDQILKRITTTPLKTWKFLVAEVASRLVLNVVQVSLILGLGVYVFHGHIYGNVFILYMIILLGAILFQLVGFAMASVAKTTDAAQSMAQAVAIPMMFLAGVFFPIDALPKWLSSIVQYLPLAPLLRMIRSIALDAKSPFENPINIAIVTGWIVILLGVSLMRFRLSEE